MVKGRGVFLDGRKGGRGKDLFDNEAGLKDVEFEVLKEMEKRHK